jgi:hypothetical protein
MRLPLQPEARVTVNTCVVCGSETPDGYACTTETERARQQLAEIAELTEAARAVMYRQTAAHGGGHSTPGPRDLLDYGAGARVDAVQTALTGWARQVAEERGSAVWVAMNGDIIGQAAKWLGGKDPDNLEWLRHVPYVDDVLREVGDCVAAMRSVVATPAGRVYLGVCGAPLLIEGIGGPVPCEGDVYGKPGKAAAYCNECGAAYDQAERRVQVAKLVDGKGFRASDIAHAYGISANTIRGWAWVKRDEQGEPLNDPKLKPVGHDHLGRPLYLVADVLALEKQAEQRRQQRAAQGAGMGA